MNAAVAVITVALERILLLQCVARHLPGAHEHRNRRNDVALVKHPVLRDVRKALGVDLDPARRSFERIGLRVLAERLERDARVGKIMDVSGPRLPEGREVGKRRDLAARFVVAPFDPLELGLSFGKGLFLAEMPCDAAADLPGRALLPLRFDRLVKRQDGGGVAVGAA